MATEEVTEEEPSHVLSFTALAMIPHYTSQISTIDSRSSASPQKYQGTPTQGAWETVPEAISLLHRMGIKPSIQMVKTAEEPLLESMENSPATKKRKFTPEFSEPITVPDPEVVVDWDDVVSLGDETLETHSKADEVKDLTNLIDESMDYLFKEIIQDA
ncbi:hypothetical protein AMATHDRAFT_10458 [Amanita thiersii Skay4041]|uniref:Uncharacterized protein n=1 Tax=Amanita thiersii Skay4041 TaxID=703135 RepID=A0A2A9N6R6_9AGAR|nr:hypothetical protein AMATHDRAFT_10458 [Amanita thiersii Skay4041]